MTSKRSTVSMFILATLALCAISSIAAEYPVGDTAGWTSMGGVDYEGWSSAQNFHVGDTLIFNYNNQFHNVKQVTLQDFQSCNPSSPIATYNNGSDTITLDRPGHYYFICGFPGHCMVGQKVRVSVSLPSPNPSPAPTQSQPGHSSPSESSAIYHSSHALVVFLGALASLSFTSSLVG